MLTESLAPMASGHAHPAAPIKIDYDRTYERWETSLPPAKLGAVYDRIGWNSFRRNQRAALLMEVRSRIFPTVLDVGCFRGDYLQALMTASLPVQYHGLDVTPSYIKHAQQRFAAARHSSLCQFKFSEGSIYHLPKAAAEIVFCTGVLIHLPDFEKPLDRLFDAATSRVIVSTAIHDKPDHELVQIRNGFLYKTWSWSFMRDALESRGTIKRLFFKRSADYPYWHCTAIVTPKDR
jgi:trans-aconitate methyltransferase